MTWVLLILILGLVVKVEIVGEQDGGVIDHLFDGRSVTGAAGLDDLVDNREIAGDLPEGGVLAVQVRRVGVHHEELAGGGVGLYGDGLTFR